MAKIVINSSAFFHNIDFLAAKAGSRDKIAAVLKDNAYGHGLIEMATLSQRHGITKAVVRNMDEAMQIVPFFKKILILGEIPKDRAPQGVSCAINDINDLKKAKQGQSIEIKVDTGMHRNGIAPNELESAFEIAINRGLNIVGVFTHYRSADELSSELFWQQKVFASIKSRAIALCGRFSIPRPLFHSCNSAALLRLKSFEDDFARVGISIYGYHEMPSVFGEYDLKPVMSLWATKISTRELKKGSRVGYGGGGVIESDTKVSSYDIGYGDGLFRLNEHQIYHTRCGKRLLGRVSMDYVSIEGDDEEVCIFEDVRAISRLYNTIVYDQLVKLSPKIPKVIETSE